VAVWHQLGHVQVCTLLQTDNHASTPPLSFLQARCPSCRPTNSIKALLPKSTILSYEHGKKRWAARLFTAPNLGSKGIIIAKVTSVEPVNATLLTS